MTPSIYQEVGVRLRELRLAAGLSQQELGDSLTPNRTQGGIAQLEQGSRKIDLETIHQLAGIFKVSPEFLLEGGWRPGKASGTNVVVIDGLDLQQAFDQYLLETPFIKLRNTEEVRLKALADPEATTVVYMGKRTFAALAERLLEAGLPPETHALIALGVSTPDQSLSCHTVGELPEVLRAMETKAPVLILYGPLADEDLPR